MVILRCTRGNLDSEAFELDPSLEYILGREPEAEEGQSIPIVLNSRSVSRNHAKIYFEASSWIIKDLKSYNGIRVNRMKVGEAHLEPGTHIDIGEFSFVLEDSNLETTSIENRKSNPVPTPIRSSAQPNKSKPIEKLKSQFLDLKSKFEDLDYPYKLLSVLGVLSLLCFFILRTPILIQIEKDLLDQTYSYAVQTAMNLAEKNKRELSDRSYYLLDCDYLRGSSVVQAASLWDRQGQQVCPVGEKPEPDYLMKLALERQELISDCDSSRGISELGICSVIVPVKVWEEEQRTQAVVGYARLEYFASDVLEDVENLKSLWLKAFVLVLVLFGICWWLCSKWVKSASEELSQEVHLLLTGTAQNIEHMQSFAAFNPIIEEINSLFSKLNQEVKSEQGPGQTEASFLQTLLQQVFLLEERAVLAVDSENHVIAMSSFVSELIPVQENPVSLHISEAIEDTHLQGEIMSFLNDLSTSNEVIERPLSMSDRVIQAHGMSVFYKDEHLATLLLF